ncbi:hypothetical protein Tco_0843463 [Tanacetum coccineum]|uniref:Uncharacterized protein n=1 Tax=Tanacetum coccineum TaxID=301880 RepID=A0ABQ5B692_9ASTR
MRLWDDMPSQFPKLVSRIDSLELDLKQTKLTMGNAIVKLVKKVKKLEGFLKRRNLVLTDLEDEEPKAQGRKSQDDPQDSSYNRLVYSLQQSICFRENKWKISAQTLLKQLKLSQKIVTAGEIKDKERKAPMLGEETPKKSKEQILQEEASLAEAIRLDSLQKEEEAKQIHLDALLAQRIAEEEELTEQQKKRKAQVQFEAQFYTNEDWDLI